MDTTDIKIEKIDPKLFTQNRRISNFTSMVRGLELDNVIAISGFSLPNCSSRANNIGLHFFPRRKYSLMTLADGRVAIKRIL